MSHTLLIENLSVQHCHQRILRDVSLNIPAGSIFGLLGDNGAGKTALLNISQDQWLITINHYHVIKLRTSVL